MSKLGHFSFNERISQLLYGSVDDGLIGMSGLKYALPKGIEGGLCTLARLCTQFDGEDGVTFTHSEVGSRAYVVEYESYKFGLPFVIVGVADGCRDTEPPV